MKNSINQNIDIIKKTYSNSIDIVFRDICFNNEKITLVYNQSLCSSDYINNFILKNISNLIKEKQTIDIDNILELLYNSSPANSIKKIKSFQEIYSNISSSHTIILFDKTNEALAIETKEKLSRTVSPPIIEQTISGPKDSFNENYLTNIGLVRKRIKSTNLVLEEKEIGKETKTRVGIFYMKNIIEKELLVEVKKKLAQISIDGIIDSTYIKEYIESKNSVFSLLAVTERPDVTCMNLLNGKICLVVENSPFVIIIPTFFLELFNAPEDYYQKSKNVIFTRMIRYISFFIGVLLPAIYIAITTFNHETIPDTLLINFALQREGVPFPAIIEALGLNLIFEILRESDIRMPSLSGSSISILGAIVLGDAAVSAGIVSPIMVMVIAVSAICSLMFSGPAMVNGIRWWRLVFMICATIFGIPGIILCGFVFIIILNDMKSFGKPYLYPIAPFNGNLFAKAFFKRNIKKEIYRNPLLTDKNYKRSSYENN